VIGEDRRVEAVVVLGEARLPGAATLGATERPVWPPVTSAEPDAPLDIALGWTL